MNRRTSLPSALGAWIGAAVALLIGCGEGRFPVCKANAECEARDAGKGNICFAMRCVECRYDTDCPVGNVCNSSQTCASLSDAPAASAEKEEAAPTWEPGPETSAKRGASKKRSAPRTPPAPDAKKP